VVQLAQCSVPSNQRSWPVFASERAQVPREQSPAVDTKQGPMFYYLLANNMHACIGSVDPRLPLRPMRANVDQTFL
jgi:hypothetical protein